MDQQLSTALADSLRQFVEAFKHGASFVQAELPDVLRQLLAWELTRSVVIVLVSLAVLVTLGLLARRYGRPERIPETEWTEYRASWAWERDGDASLAGFLAAFLGGFTAMFAAGFFVDGVLDAVKILIAPKVFLLEYAASFVKKG